MTAKAMLVGSGRMTETVVSYPDTSSHAVHIPYQASRSNAVIILERDGSLARSGPENQASQPTSGYAEFSADRVDQPDNIIDRVVSYAFDTLGLTTLELRVNERT